MRIRCVLEEIYIYRVIINKYYSHIKENIIDKAIIIVNPKNIFCLKKQNEPIRIIKVAIIQ